VFFIENKGRKVRFSRAPGLGLENLRLFFPKVGLFPPE
jgi:hypothetical protein